MEDSWRSSRGGLATERSRVAPLKSPSLWLPSQMLIRWFRAVLEAPARRPALVTPNGIPFNDAAQANGDGDGGMPEKKRLLFSAFNPAIVSFPVRILTILSMLVC